MAKQRFSRPSSLSKAHIENVPNEKPAVYKIKDSKGENIYTGVAQRGRIQDRLAEHMPRGSDAITGAKSFSYKPKRSIDSARSEEKQIIRKEKPKYNEQSRK